MVLRSFLDYNHLIEFSMEDGEFKDLRTASESCQGNFMPLGNQMILFYRNNDRLYLNLGGKKEIEISEKNQVFLINHGNSNYEFVLKEDDETLLSFEYVFEKENYLFDDDPTGFVEEEDFNYGLFLKTVISNPYRLEHIFR